MNPISQEELKQWLSYDEETGIFKWIKINSCRVYVGRVAGTTRKKSPYVIIVINRQFYYAHRLAWLFVHGTLPDGMIDHIDRNPSNNAISNLRIATFHQNAINRAVSPKSKTGLKGVWFNKGRFSAYIGSAGQRIRLGAFDSAEEAHAAYVAASKKIHGEFSSVQP